MADLSEPLIAAKCPHCGKIAEYSLPAKIRGAAGQCPGCKRWFTVVRSDLKMPRAEPTKEAGKKDVGKKDAKA